MTFEAAPSTVFAVPGDPDQRTGGYIYDARLKAALAAIGMPVQHLRLPDGFPFPSTTALQATQAALAALPDATRLLVDGLAFSVLPDLMRACAQRLGVTALIHHPLAYETGLAAETAARLRASERTALASAHRVITTSSATRDQLIADFAVPGERITVAWPGTDPAPLATGSGGPGVALLAVGTIIRRKGFPELVHALGTLAGLDWTLTIVGSLTRDADEVARLRDAIESLGVLGGRIALQGELAGSALANAYARADLFISNSIYEGFGMALAEAVAHGLPIVAADGGAVGGWMPKAAALLTPPGDAGALSAALRRAIGDATTRARLRQGAVAARGSLPDWPTTARIVADVLAEGRG